MQVRAACSSLLDGWLDESPTTAQEAGTDTAAVKLSHLLPLTVFMAHFRSGLRTGVTCLQEAGADTAAFKRSLQDVDAKAARQLTGELTRAGAAVYDALQHERELREVRQRWVPQSWQLPVPGSGLLEAWLATAAQSKHLLWCFTEPVPACQPANASGELHVMSLCQDPHRCMHT